MKGQRDRTAARGTQLPHSRWEKMAIQDFGADELYRFYERSGIYQLGGRMTAEEADKRAFLEVVRVDSSASVRGGVA